MCQEKDIKKIKEILGENLVALAEYNNGDEVRCLAICKALDFKTLAGLKELSNAPVLFTQEEINNALDVFPVEFLNIKRHHKMLYGEDILKDIDISKDDLRRQLEFEFRSKLIHLRRSYIMANIDGKELEEIILNAVPNLAPIIGALMYLKDVKTRYDPDLIKVMVGIDTKVVNDIHNIRIGRAKFEGDRNKYVERLINLLTQVGTIVNGMKVN